MNLNNLSVSMGLEIKDICFTQTEWAMFADAVNKSNTAALNAGLVIGFAAGVIGVFAALKYLEYKRNKEG